MICMEKKKIEILNSVNVIGFILVMCAGWIDIVGLKISVTERTSFLTGRAAMLGESFFNGDFSKALVVILIVASFIFGAYIGTIITEKKGCKYGLLLTSFLIILSALVLSEFNQLEINIALILIPIATGCLNASTSLTKIGRTTHLTGPATDIGIFLAKKDYNKVIFWALHWIAFPLGAFLGLYFLSLFQKHLLPLPSVLLIPATLIIGVSMVFNYFISD